tara:strand:- start:1475 stop:2194 length:720 start_codon:yes stop_codon:yes gene_type:complete
MSLVDILKEATPKYELTIPSTGESKAFRPFLVKEEKILLIAKESSDEVVIMKSVRDLIKSCVDDMDNIEDLPMFDIEYIYLQLRAKSIGEILTPTFVCPETKEKIKLNLNIDDIEVVRNENHKNEIAITSDIIITMKYPSINIIEGMHKNEHNNENAVPLFDLIVNTIEKIETKEETLTNDVISKTELEEFVNNFTKEQYEKVVEFFTTSPKLEHTLKYTTKDGKEHEAVLRGLLDFFR